VVYHDNKSDTSLPQLRAAIFDSCCSTEGLLQPFLPTFTLASCSQSSLTELLATLTALAKLTFHEFT
jgi:hypothetical protein